MTPDQLIARLEGEKRRLAELGSFAERTGDMSVEACIASSFNALSPQMQVEEAF